MEDLIKREDAIKAISISCGTCLARDTEDCDKCSVPKLCGLISAIPSADRPQGEWLNYKDEHTCSICKEVVIDDWYYEYEWYDFCPHCGARMKDVTEGLESRTDLIWYGDKTDLIGDETGRHTGWFGKGADDEDN